MLVELYRLSGRTTLASTGGLLSLDGTSQFTTLEPADGPQLIPPGTYHVKKELSPRFAELTPHLYDVPGHTYIEMHPGNHPKDTHGCILIGETFSPDFIGLSHAAFEAFMQLVPDEFDLTIWPIR